MIPFILLNEIVNLIVFSKLVMELIALRTVQTQSPIQVREIFNDEYIYIFCVDVDVDENKITAVLTSDLIHNPTIYMRITGSK